jgi:carbamoyl-phosphate synthase large subunit
LEDAGCVVLVSDPEVIAMAADKCQTQEVFSAAGIAVPVGWPAESAPSVGLPDRLVVKPRHGSASQDVHLIDSFQLATVLPGVAQAIVQERLFGPEITIDALLGLQGEMIHYVPRRRIRTLAGESIQGVTISDDGLRDWIIRVLGIVSSMGGRGPITIQTFLTDNGPVLTEVNPRFGGGFPLTHAAGGRYPEWLVAAVRGDSSPLVLGDYEVGLHMTRYYVEEFVTSPRW